MKMTPRKEIDFIENEVRIDVRFCSDEDVDKTVEVFKFAESALKKQIPKKPNYYDSVPHNRCPNCGCAVKVFYDAHEYHYCLYCGQALDWGYEK